MSVANLKFVITGSGDGIGASTARIAAAQGAKICVVDITDTNALQVVAQIEQAGGSAWFIKCDVTDDAQLEDLMAQAAGHMGGIDVLVNNAGIHDSSLGTPEQSQFESFDRRIWDKVLAVNLTAPMFAAKAALPWLKKSTNGSVINAGSTASFVGYPSTLAYGTSKGGIAQLTKNLAISLAPYGVRCNAYCPGPIKTPMVARRFGETPDPAAAERHMVRQNLMPRLGSPDEVAELICVLAGDTCRYVNGVTWLIDGGMLAWRDTAEAIGM